MIRTIADFLEELMREEARQLERQGIKHGPTIGHMYEGLTRTVLEDRVLPPSLDLRVVSGFVSGPDGKLSSQQDVLIAHGEGYRLPYVDAHVWPVQRVLAVLEVKKTLYSAEILDSLKGLKTVVDSHLRYLNHPDPERQDDVEVNLGPIERTFAQMTGRVAPKYNRLDQAEWKHATLYRVLLLEYLRPLRIVFGYGGFSSEHGLRGAIWGILQNQVGNEGFGPGGLPHLMVSGGYSLFKATAEPYVSPLSKEGWWTFLWSSSDNPLRFLLELLFTRIERVLGVSGFWGDDLELESGTALLSARPCRKEGHMGWECRFESFSAEALAAVRSPLDWNPAELSEHEAVLLNLLAKGYPLPPGDEALVEASRQTGKPVEELVQDLVQTRLVAVDDEGALQIIAERLEIGFLPDGRVTASGGDRGRFLTWLARQPQDS